MKRYIPQLILLLLVGTAALSLSCGPVAVLGELVGDFAGDSSAEKEGNANQSERQEEDTSSSLVRRRKTTASRFHRIVIGVCFRKTPDLRITSIQFQPLPTHVPSASVFSQITAPMLV